MNMVCQSQTEKTFITDPELDIAIHRITTRNPRLGIVMIQGELRSKFGIAIHGAIDGCSRKILYMEACNDKTAETVKCLFLNAIAEYGWPHRIRTDKGGENCLVGRLMQERRSEKNPTPHCVGSSVHNQRIERLWVDVRHCVTQLFMDMFFDLQSASLLDKDNPVDFYCARAVFTTTVNFQLQKFKTHWNNHSMSTQSQATPNQVFVSGAMKRHGSGLEEVAGMINAKPLENTNDNDNENEEHDPLVPENETEEEVAELLPAINDVSVPETKKEELQILFACSGDDLDLGWSRYLHARSLFS
eukprot:gene7-434_t